MSKGTWSNFLTWLADLGQNWAMASDPAVMQASGYKSTPEGVKYEDSDGAKRLRENLAVLSGTANTLTNIGLSGVGPALASEAGAVVGGIAGSKIGEEIDEHAGTTYWSPVLGFAGTMFGGYAPYAASRYWNGLKTTWNSGRTVRPDYANLGGEFVDDVAVNSRQQYLPKQSKLSSGELQGLPATLVTRRSGHGFLAPWDKQWDDAYFKALAHGDIEKVQFLRDLHFHDASVSNRLISGQKPIKLYHNTDKSFTEFDLSKIGTANDPGFYGHGIYTSPDPNYSSTYGQKQMVLYGNLTNPFVTNGDLVRSAQSYNFGRSFDYTLVDIPSGIRRSLENADGVIHTGPSYLRGGQPIEEVVFSKPNQLKLADPITYDDAGNIIPLSQRDNFEIKDLRYVAFPAAVGGGISLIKNNSTQNGK